MAFSIKEIDGKIIKREKEKELALQKINTITDNCNAKKKALDEKCKNDLKPYEDKVNEVEKEISKLKGIRAKFEKLEAEFLK